MTVKVTVPNTSSDSVVFGSANTPTAAEVVGIDSGSSNGQLAFKTTASGTSTERMRIDASGNVGIGTSSPITTSARLSVKASGDYDAGLAIGSNASAVNWARLDLKNTNAASPSIIYQDQAGTLSIRTDAAYPIKFETNGANERMRIDGSGVISFKANNSSNTTHVFTYNENGGEIALYDNAGSYGSLFDLSTGNTRLVHVLSTGDLSLGIGGANTTGSVIFYRAGFNEAMRIGPSGQLGIGGANYGSSGQVLTSQGSGAAPSWVDSRGMTLLGTLTTTSGSAQTLSGLNLTTYKTLVIYLNNVSMSASAQVRLNSIAITQGTGASGNSVWGACFVDLSIGTFAAISSATASSTGTLSNTGVTNNGNCGVTTAATALVFSPNTGTFDAGTITVYGVS